MKPSASELVLLKSLWPSDGLSAREVHEAALDNLDWSFSSTRKTLDRMEDKGLIKVEHRHGVKVYVSAAAKVGVIAELTRDFLDRVLEMGGPLPASAFSGSQLLNDDEIAELERTLRNETEDRS